jgi:hypothetical protein
VSRPGRAFILLTGYLAALLAIDQVMDARGQLLLGAATWGLLLGVCRRLTPERRAQVAVVIAAATLAELTGSIVWGVYTYRLENLPSFVPPAHGLVYLAGVSLSVFAARHRHLLVGAALCAVSIWGLAGLTVLPRKDLGGALGAVLLGYYLLRGRAPGVYAGVFLVVAGLELYGTALGTWTWAETIPGTGIPNGNPPSGVASGYVWFDVMALALATRLLAVRAKFAPARAEETKERGRLAPAPRFLPGGVG